MENGTRELELTGGFDCDISLYFAREVFIAFCIAEYLYSTSIEVFD
jgi:hypothetical protein